MTGTDSPKVTGGQGPLARLLGTRGGTASAEAPFVIEHREALIYLLCEAAELEHTIMCQYLYAAFTLKEHPNEGLSADELVAVTRWRKSIGHVAAQEMLHLALVQNVLTAIGGAPHLGRPNLPAPSRHFPAAVVLELLPFGEAALEHFMFLERPEGMDLDDAAGLTAMARSAPAGRAVQRGDIVPRPQDFATIGHLYRSIEVGLDFLAESYGETGLFVGPPRAQATAAAFGWPELVAVTDLATARQALDTILEQGEGARGAWQDAHFGQFVDILDELQHLQAANPAFDPVRPVKPANVRPSEHGADTALIGDPSTAHVVDLFNVGYEILLLMLERFFAHTEESDAQLQTLADAAVAVMLRVLRPLGGLITTLPVGPDHPGRTAGPSFELFYESDYLMPHQGAAWTLLEERLRDAAAFCDRGCAVVGEETAERLETVTGALADVADTLAAHFPEWGALSRFARPAEAAQAVSNAADLGPLLDRAHELTAALPNASGGAVAEIFTAAVALLADVAADPAAEGREHLAGRLVESVLRPLGDALDAGLTVTAEPTGAAEPLWALAQDATGLRAALPVGAPGGAALIEATAALQDLAVTYAANEAEAADRLNRLRELQGDLEPAIRTSPAGPYLVTNAETLRDHLGRDLPTRPQLALCRCGASAAKPFCDGSHARIGFTDEKDPKRVPDRQDVYVGQQVTVLDNRGICQHSGLCTDRLSGVFHSGGEPFVTPSGGRMDEIVRAARDCPSGALSYVLGGEATAKADESRAPAIEVTRDGPYRVTGAIALTGPDDRPVVKAVGGSDEHYALCRCGQSQNKPFCSGMHYYVGFTDPPPAEEPTLFEWAGGLPALTRMTRMFYEKYVPDDPLLGPLFACMSADHPERVAGWLGEVFGGPPAYSTQHGGYQQMIAEHRDKGLTEEQRARWVQLITRSAADAGLPNDAEFAAAFRSYLEWGSRLAVENSQPGAAPPPVMPMPRWGWDTAAGPPRGRVSALAPEEPAEAPPELPAAGEQVGFAAHIRPLFRERDRRSMRFAFDLWSYDEVLPHAADVLERVRSGNMPCDGAWPPEWVDVLQRWVDDGGRP